MHQLTETVSKITTFKKLMAIAALACTIFAGTMTADVVKAERSNRGLDPMIHAIIDAVESGKPICSNDFAPKTTLKQRTKTTKKPVKIGSRSRLKIKFADELRVRISDDGQLVSRTNKSIGTVIDTIQALGVTLTPTANVEESKIDELISRAEARSGKQMPDIGGVFWVDGPASSVSVAANIFFSMPEVEWLLSHTLLPYETSNGKSQLIRNNQRSFNPPDQQFVSKLTNAKNSGACYLRSNECLDGVSSSECSNLGGVFLGTGSVCNADDPNESRGAGTACCTLVSCIDSTFAACMAINGIWFGIDTDTCADVIDTCPPAFDQYSLCGEFGNLPTYFAGDCYIDQTIQLVENRSIFAAGCLDSNSFPNPQEGFIDADQNCCPEVAALAPQCATDFWDATCASYANSPLLIGSCLQAGTECAAPFGPERLEAQQPKMNFADDCPDPVAPFNVNCWPFNPAIQYFAPQLTTPNYYKMGLQPWSTDEVISYNDWGLAVPNALRELLPWPMGGATIQSTSYTIVDDPDAPGGPFIAQTMWGGQGLNLHAKDPNASQGGMNSADRYSGLYGLGELHQDLSGVPNGTFGAGVTIAVLDYAAFLQQYSTSDGQGGLFWWGAVHEELTNIKLEGTHTTHDYVEMVFDPAAPFRFSADHGSAVLGVIAGSWDTNDADSNTGIQGIVPESEVIFFPLVGRDANGLAQGRSGTAWINAMLSLDPGDILAATYSASSGNGGGINNLDYNADTHDKITLATALGISVVIAAGDTGVDLLDIGTPDGQDSGAIVVAAVSPGANRLFLEDTDFDDDYADADANRRKNWKRWADGIRGSNFTSSIDFSKITVAGWGTGITTCGMGTNRDNWLGYQTVAYPNGCDYNEVAAKSYTNNFGRTSAAAAMAVGCIAGMQGYSIQVFGSPLSPLFTRLYIGGGSYVGITPTDPDVPGSGGAPILSFPLSTNLTTENDLTHADPPPEPWTTWDWVLDQDGIGNLTGNFLDPWTSCQQVLADPIFDTPGIDNDIMVLRGDYHMGNSTSIAAQDNMYFSVVPEHTFVGDYSMPSDYTGPGDHVTYLSTAFVTDIYLTGQLRGGLSPRNFLEWNLLLRDAEFTSTILLVYMWDYSRRTWVQASTSEVLGPDDVNADGLIDVQFIVPRSSRMIDRLDRYHARFVTVTQDDGDNQLFPFMYDQIRVSSGSMPGPISMP